ARACRTGRADYPLREAAQGRKSPRPGEWTAREVQRVAAHLFERKGLLAIILVLGLLGAIASLAQPLLVGQVIERVSATEPITLLVCILVILVLASALFDSFQHYLLQRMGEGVVLSSRRVHIAKILHLPIGEFDRRRT